MQGDVEHSLLGSAGRSGILHLQEDQTRAVTVPRAIIWGAENTRSGARSRTPGTGSDTRRSGLSTVPRTTS